MGSRREGRILALQMLYAYDVGQDLEELLKFEWAETETTKPGEDARLFASLLVQGTLANLTAIDRIIEENLKYKDLKLLKRIDHALLRLSVYMLLYQEGNRAVTVSEAIEISKKFGHDDSSFKFINGVLGAICRVN
jgi:N utilization substance protein B